MKAAVFIDYDNLNDIQKRTGIFKVVINALFQSNLPSYRGIVSCDVRIYGGWYEESKITRTAEDVSAEIEREFPKIIKIQNDDMFDIVVNTRASLAMALMKHPDRHLYHTYRRKGRPRNIKIADVEDAGCQRENCLLPKVKEFLKTGRCPNEGCIVDKADLLYRHEQKIVDTMLTCDMIYAQSFGYSTIVLVSSDDDFIPPLIMVSVPGIHVVRIHTSPDNQRYSYMDQNKTQLLERELSACR